MRGLFAGAALAAACALVPVGQALAADITVISGGAARAGVEPLLKRFEEVSGNKVRMSFGTMGLIKEKLDRGERADLLIISSEMADDLAKSGAIVPASRKPLVKVGIGVAVNETASVPDISTPEAFKAALLNAKSIVYVDPTKGTSGKYLVGLFDRMGIAAQLQPKTHLGDGGYVVEPVGRGEIELGLAQISEIYPVKGIKFAGPLPEPLQKWSEYAAAATPGASPAVAQLVEFLTGAEAKKVFESKGFVPTN
jgi:molybdate transport system substrate-binding protein